MQKADSLETADRYISEMETGERFSLPPEKPEEFVYPYASPLDELRAADKAYMT